MTGIYIFDCKDGKSADERLKLAVLHYCRACGKQLIQSEADLSELLRVARTERGKPYFPQCPQIQFSISHSGSYWVCAISEEQIGVDIQEHVRLKEESVEEAAVRFRKMAHRFFHPTEAEFVESDCYNNFFTVWSARESYVKYTGQGIDSEFSDYCVVPTEKKLWAEMLNSTESVKWQAQSVWFWKIQYKEAYTLCVCTKMQMEYIIVGAEALTD